MSAPGTLKLQVQWPANRAKLIELEQLRDRFRLGLNGGNTPPEEQDESDALIGRIIYGHPFTILREDETKVLETVVGISKKLGPKNPVRVFSWFTKEIPETFISPLTLNLVDGGIITQKVVSNAMQQPDAYKRDALWAYKKKESTAGRVTVSGNKGGKTKSGWFKDTASFSAPKRNSKDHEILGLSNEATWEEIRKAYKKLAFAHHPDRNQNDSTALDKFMKVDGAYKRLKTLYGESVVQSLIDKTINEVIDVEKDPII